jgi:hypothetical protein
MAQLRWGRQMRRGHAGRWGLAGAAALAVHLCLLAMLAMRTGPMTVRQYGEDALEVTLVPPIYLPRRARPAPPAPPEPRPAKAPRTAVAPLPMPPNESQSGPAAPSPASQGPAQALNGDLGAALRRRLGCARTDQTGLSQAERLACADALGQGARTAAALGQTLPAGKRAYYEAVMAARKSEGHGPGLGCHIRFGGGKPASVETPAHGLKLGPLPCFIVPPAGMLTPEADIPNPY